uniref:CBS domain-containing protein n=1 Tax=Arcella intermedia TaxID=1963864 RepID=A0A6B2LP56_9EUKA
MNDKKIGALLVKDYQGKICGIITERDYLNKVALKGLRSWETKVSSIMTPNPRGVTPRATVMRCLTLMTHYRFRHLVVLSESDQAVIGLVSIGDLVKAVLEQYKETIYFLREYIEKRW